MYKKLYPHILIFILLLSSGMASAQELIMEETVESSPGSSLFGQNKKHFIETRLFYGFLNIWDDNSYPVKFFGSGEFEALVRYKLKISPILSTGTSAAFLNQEYISDNTNIPDSLSNDRDVFKISSLKSTIFLRFNFDPKRGNYLGKYIETGMYGSWSYSLKKEITNNYDESDELGIRKSKEILSGLDFLNRIQYGTYVSLGFGNYEISYRHRMSWIFNENTYPEDQRIDFSLRDFSRNTLGLSIRIGT